MKEKSFPDGWLSIDCRACFCNHLVFNVLYILWRQSVHFKEYLAAFGNGSHSLSVNSDNSRGNGHWWLCFLLNEGAV